eukprot:7556-Rhodomonas_salina.3
MCGTDVGYAATRTSTSSAPGTTTPLSPYGALGMQCLVLRQPMILPGAWRVAMTGLPGSPFAWVCSAIASPSRAFLPQLFSPVFLRIVALSTRPQTLHPRPYTLDPTPYTLDPRLYWTLKHVCCWQQEHVNDASLSGKPFSTAAWTIEGFQVAVFADFSFFFSIFSLFFFSGGGGGHMGCLDVE